MRKTGLRARPGVEALEGRTLLSGVIHGKVHSFSITGVITSITGGPDGNLWFAERNSDRITAEIGRLGVSGTLAEFPLPRGVSPSLIVSGGDGNLWFDEGAGGKIGRITPGGVITEFPLPPGGSIRALAPGADSNVWFIQSGSISYSGTAATVQSDLIGRITSVGVVTEFPLEGETQQNVGSLSGLTTGPDGNEWFTELRANKIGRITESGAMTEFSLPSGSNPGKIVSGPDHNLWFTEFGRNVIGRITPVGVVTEFKLRGDQFPTDIAVGRDGNLWFAQGGSRAIGRITTNGVASELPLPKPLVLPVGITSGSDGNIWFGAEDSHNPQAPNGKVAQLVLRTVPRPPRTGAKRGHGVPIFKHVGARALGY